MEGLVRAAVWVLLIFTLPIRAMPSGKETENISDVRELSCVESQKTWYTNITRATIDFKEVSQMDCEIVIEDVDSPVVIDVMIRKFYRHGWKGEQPWDCEEASVGIGSEEDTEHKICEEVKEKTFTFYHTHSSITIFLEIDINSDKEHVSFEAELSVLPFRSMEQDADKQLLPRIKSHNYGEGYITSHPDYLHKALETDVKYSLIFYVPCDYVIQFEVLEIESGMREGDNGQVRVSNLPINIIIAVDSTGGVPYSKYQRGSAVEVADTISFSYGPQELSKDSKVFGFRLKYQWRHILLPLAEFSSCLPTSTDTLMNTRSTSGFDTTMDFEQVTPSIGVSTDVSVLTCSDGTDAVYRNFTHGRIQGPGRPVNCKVTIVDLDPPALILLTTSKLPCSEGHVEIVAPITSENHTYCNQYNVDTQRTYYRVFIRSSSDAGLKVYSSTQKEFDIGIEVFPVRSLQPVDQTRIQHSVQQSSILFPRILSHYSGKGYITSHPEYPKGSVRSNVTYVLSLRVPCDKPVNLSFTPDSTNFANIRRHVTITLTDLEGIETTTQFQYEAQLTVIVKNSITFRYSTSRTLSTRGFILSYTWRRLLPPSATISDCQHTTTEEIVTTPTTGGNGRTLTIEQPTTPAIGVSANVPVLTCSDGTDAAYKNFTHGRIQGTGNPVNCKVTIVDVDPPVLILVTTSLVPCSDGQVKLILPVAGKNLSYCNPSGVDNRKTSRIFHKSGSVAELKISSSSSLQFDIGIEVFPVRSLQPVDQARVQRSVQQPSLLFPRVKSHYFGKGYITSHPEYPQSSMKSNATYVLSLRVPCDKPVSLSFTSESKNITNIGRHVTITLTDLEGKETRKSLFEAWLIVKNSVTFRYTTSTAVSFRGFMLSYNWSRLGSALDPQDRQKCLTTATPVQTTEIENTESPGGEEMTTDSGSPRQGRSVLIYGVSGGVAAVVVVALIIIIVVVCRRRNRDVPSSKGEDKFTHSAASNDYGGNGNGVKEEDHEYAYTDGYMGIPAKGSSTYQQCVNPAFTGDSHNYDVINTPRTKARIDHNLHDGDDNHYYTGEEVAAYADINDTAECNAYSLADEDRPTGSDMGESSEDGEYHTIEESGGAANNNYLLAGDEVDATRNTNRDPNIDGELERKTYSFAEEIKSKAGNEVVNGGDYHTLEKPRLVATPLTDEELQTPIPMVKNTLYDFDYADNAVDTNGEYHVIDGANP